MRSEEGGCATKKWSGWGERVEESGGGERGTGESGEEAARVRERSE
jgi:hypothetical protein